MATIINKISQIGNWAMGLYDKAMKSIFNIKTLHAYYENREQICKLIKKKYLRKHDVTAEELNEKGFAATIGAQAASKTADRCIYHHAFMAFCMTTLCTIPDNWLMWPAIVIDIVFIQYEQFAVAQEIETIYGSKKKKSFNYDMLAVSAVKMSGVMVKSKVQDTAKKGFDKAIRGAIKKGASVFKGPLKALLRQGLKWVGIITAKDHMDYDIDTLTGTIIDWSVIGICALIAGFVSFWLFVPMSKRLKED